MKVKALRYKKEFNFFQEFVRIEEVGGEPMVFTSEIPDLQPETANLEDMRKIFEEEDSYEGLDLDFNKLELVEFDLIESGEVGADIRNKLSPPLNLVALLKIYFKDEEITPTTKESVVKLIKAEMEKTEKSIKYISNIL